MIRLAPPLARVLFPAALLVLGMLGACAGPAREPLDSFAGLGGGETVVVGRVELVPPLRKNEQQIKGLGTSRFENKIFLIADERQRKLTKEPTVADYTGRIEATLGETFFVRSSNKPFYIVAGMMYLDLGGSAFNQAYFPGGLKVTINPGDKAVYVGTLRYHRDEFFEITRVVVVDDYERANAEYKKKYKTNYPLRKALFTSVK